MPAFGGEPESREIQPTKASVTKHIHILFDKSGSMNMKDYQLGYAEVQAIAMQGVDDFEIAATAFGRNSVRLNPKWLKMPSVENYNLLMTFLKEVRVDIRDTFVSDAIAQIIKEKKKGVSVIIITDGEIADYDKMIKLLEASKDYTFPIGVVDTNGNKYATEHEHLIISFLRKRKNCWYIDLKQPEEEKDE